MSLELRAGLADGFSPDGTALDELAALIKAKSIERAYLTGSDTTKVKAIFEESKDVFLSQARSFLESFACEGRRYFEQKLNALSSSAETQAEELITKSESSNEPQPFTLPKQKGLGGPATDLPESLVARIEDALVREESLQYIRMYPVVENIHGKTIEGKLYNYFPVLSEAKGQVPPGGRRRGLFFASTQFEPNAPVVFFSPPPNGNLWKVYAHQHREYQVHIHKETNHHQQSLFFCFGVCFTEFAEKDLKVVVTMQNPHPTLLGAGEDLRFVVTDTGGRQSLVLPERVEGSLRFDLCGSPESYFVVSLTPPLLFYRDFALLTPGGPLNAASRTSIGVMTALPEPTWAKQQTPHQQLRQVASPASVAVLQSQRDQGTPSGHRLHRRPSTTERRVGDCA